MGLGKGKQFKRSTKTGDKHLARRQVAQLHQEFEEICLKAETGPVELPYPTIMQMISKWYTDSYNRHITRPSKVVDWDILRDQLSDCLKEVVDEEGDADISFFEEAVGDIGNVILREHKVSLKQESRYTLLKHLAQYVFGFYSTMMMRAGGNFSADSYASSLPAYSITDLANELASAEPEMERLMQDYFNERREANGLEAQDQTEREYRSSFYEFIEFTGSSRPLQSLTRKDVIAFKDHLLTELKVKPVTINKKRLAAVKAILNWGADNERVPMGITDKVRAKEPKVARKARWPFTMEQAALLLREARKQEDHKKWLVWIAAATGARLNEIVQLTKEDIVRFQGVDCFDFTNRQAGKSSKNVQSIRKAPIHPALASEGFLDWVKSRPDGPLFEWPAGKEEPRNKAGKWFNNTFRKGLGIDLVPEGSRTSVYSFHSWRHWYEDELRNASVPGGLAAAITGRTEQGSVRDYGEGAQMQTLLDQMAKISFDFVDEEENDHEKA